MTPTPEWWHALIAFGAALIAGTVNAVAGGGTNVSFPVLLWLGLPPVAADATNMLALWPGTWGSAWGFRHKIRQAGRFWLATVGAALIGGIAGALLLITTPSSFFEALAPWLVLASTALIAARPKIDQLLGREPEGRATPHRVVAIVSVMVISAYGGYFGAGLGILFLTGLSLLGLDDLRVANGMKNLYGVAIRGIACLLFAATGHIVWWAALIMAGGALAGGYLGGVIGPRIGAGTMRWLVVVIGAGMGLAMLLQRFLGGT